MDELQSKIDNGTFVQFPPHAAHLVAGFLSRRLKHAPIPLLPHTVVDRRYRGHGLAARLVEHALDDARSQGLHVEPRCWYVAEHIGRHPEHLDLVPEGERRRYGL